VEEQGPFADAFEQISEVLGRVGTFTGTGAPVECTVLVGVRDERVRLGKAFARAPGYKLSVATAALPERPQPGHTFVVDAVTYTVRDTRVDPVAASYDCDCDTTAPAP
jgi:hypothetical protein